MAGQLNRGPSSPLVKIDEEMRQLSALLAGELKRWPDVTSRKMFGMIAFYRTIPDFPKPKIFACVPVTRALSHPRTIAFKLAKPRPSQLTRLKSDARIATEIDDSGEQKWIEFEIPSPGEMNEALWWLEQAYRAVARK